MKILFIAIFISGIFAISAGANSSLEIHGDGNSLIWWCGSIDKTESQITDVEKIKNAYCSSYILGVRIGVIWGSGESDCAVKLNIKELPSP